jgi:hypothetical protein
MGMPPVPWRCRRRPRPSKSSRARHDRD